MTASISAHSTNIASTIIHAYAYHYNLSLCMCHVQPTVYQRNSYCIRDIHVTEAIRSYTPISRALLIYGIPFTHADILIFSCDLGLCNNIIASLQICMHIIIIVVVMLISWIVLSRFLIVLVCITNVLYFYAMITN